MSFCVRNTALPVPVEMDGPRFGAWDATQQLRRVKVFGLIYS
jgi:hypothetical protein